LVDLRRFELRSSEWKS